MCNSQRSLRLSLLAAKSAHWIATRSTAPGAQARREFSFARFCGRHAYDDANANVARVPNDRVARRSLRTLAATVINVDAKFKHIVGSTALATKQTSKAEPRPRW